MTKVLNFWPDGGHCTADRRLFHRVSLFSSIPCCTFHASRTGTAGPRGWHYRFACGSCVRMYNAWLFWKGNAIHNGTLWCVPLVFSRLQKPPAKIIMLMDLNNHKNANVNDAGGCGRELAVAVILMEGSSSCMGNNNKNNENGHDSNEHEIIRGKCEGETNSIVVVTVAQARPCEIV